MGAAFSPFVARWGGVGVAFVPASEFDPGGHGIALGGGRGRFVSPRLSIQPQEDKDASEKGHHASEPREELNGEARKVHCGW